MPIRAVIFDMDGTITRPYFDWPAMKRAMGLPLDRPILEALEALAPADRERCEAQLQAFEDEAAERSELNPGAREALAYLKRRGILTGILTRNSARSVARVLERHGLAFDTVVTRHCAPPKPAPDAIFLIAERLGRQGFPIPPAELVMVGDYEFDIIAGRRAGAHTVLVTNGQPNDFTTKADVDIETLADLPAAIERIETHCRPT
jgi:HAD superfamily hydrolase (TIGR01509 family)